ncbi:hypothetical protein [Nonomuraea dietziae]|uniref:hypothetical protein n=1 Tax=Nonomuraea dietziae TaxID=65515 RepID=UPI0033D6A1E9
MRRTDPAPCGYFGGVHVAPPLPPVCANVLVLTEDHIPSIGLTTTPVATTIVESLDVSGSVSLPDDPDPEITCLNTTPQEMAAETLAGFPVRFEWALDDLRALVSGRPIIAENWGLHPQLVVPVTGSPRQMVVMVPTEEFRDRQLRALTRAATLGHDVSDPGRAQRNRLERDRLIADDAVTPARRLGISVIEVDGTRDAAAVADIVADHFRPHLPPPEDHEADRDGFGCHLAG